MNPGAVHAAVLSSRVLRWEPGTVVSPAEGIGVLDFMVPGSAGLMAANVEGLRHHQVVVWSKHGVRARSDLSVTRAVDRIEYAETDARYEYMHLVAGRQGEGRTTEELTQVATTFEVTSPWV